MLSLEVGKLSSPPESLSTSVSQVDSEPGVPGLGLEMEIVSTCGPCWKATATQSRKGQRHRAAHRGGELRGRKEMGELAVFVLGASRTSLLTLRPSSALPSDGYTSGSWRHSKMSRQVDVHRGRRKLRHSC